MAAAASTRPVVGALELPPDRPTAPAWPLLCGLLVLALVAAAIAAALFHVAVAERRGALQSAVAVRLEALAHGRAAVLATWLDGLETFARRLTRSDLIRLFVVELSAARRDGALPAGLDEQLPYMRMALDELARQGELVGAYLVDGRGELLLADSLAPPLTELQRRAAGEAAAAGAPRRLGPIVAWGGHLILDLYLSMRAPQAEGPGAPPPVGALVLRVAVEDRLARALGSGPLDLQGERARLQLGEPPAASVVIGVGGRPVLHEAEAPPPAAEPFVAEAAVPGTAWRVVQEMAATEALRPLDDFRRGAALVAATTGTMLALAAGLLWWRQRSRHLAALLGQYRDLAGRLRRQHDLLHGILTVIPDLVGVKAADGRYRLVNPAFAKALGSAAEAVIGHGDEDLLPADAAAVLRRLDGEASRLGRAACDEVELRLPGGDRHLSLAAVRLAGDEAMRAGTVIVARDVTDAVMRRRERERGTAQILAALTRTIELADSYLCGHSQRLQKVAVALAERLGLGPRAVATVGAAAALSQIGKAFVPRRILAKHGRHTPAETAILRRHVDHAQAVLRELELEPSVVEALAQMYERLDGSGYPDGLAGDRIGVPARVLAVADVLCARTQPRSYRAAVPAATVLAVLRDHPECYDAAVVAALAELIEEASTDEPKNALA